MVVRRHVTGTVTHRLPIPARVPVGVGMAAGADLNHRLNNNTVRVTIYRSFIAILQLVLGRNAAVISVDR